MEEFGRKWSKWQLNLLYQLRPRRAAQSFSPFSTLLFFTLTLSLFSSLTWSQDGEEPFEVLEGFVQLRLDTSGDSFYRVMMDQDETPYLLIPDVFENWLEMEADCQMTRQYCQSTMMPSGRIFWIDGTEKQMGRSDSKVTHPIPENGLVIIDGEMWLRYDLWTTWIPANFIWNLQYYSLAIEPRFAMIEDRKKTREKSRIQNRQRKQYIDSLSKLPALKPQGNFQAEARYNLSTQQTPDGEVSSALTYDIGADIWEGRLEASGSYLSRIKQFDPVTYWKYEKLKQPSYHRLELGYTRYDSGLLVGAVDLTNGFRLDRKERDLSAGTFEYRGHAEPGTEIEVYQNGFLETVLTADEEGTYVLPTRFAAGGDRLEFRLFLPDGSEDNFAFNIADGNGFILKSGEWDGSFINGESEQGGFSYGDLRYGLFENFTAGIHAFQLPSVIDDQAFEGHQGQFLGAADIAWRPFRGLSLSYENINGQGAADNAFGATVTEWQNHLLQLRSVRYAPESPLLRTRLLTIDSLQTDSLLYSLQFARLKLLTQATLTDNAKTYEVAADTRITRNLSVKLDSTLIDQEAVGISQETIYGINYTRSNNHILGLSYVENPTTPSWSLRYKYTSDYQRPWKKTNDGQPGWNFNVNVTQQVDQDPVWDLGLSWRQNRNLFFSFSANTEGFGFQVTWQDALKGNRPELSDKNMQWQRQEWNGFGNGTVSGILATPESPNRPAQPLANVHLRAGSKEVVTDNNGAFTISGIPPYERIKFEIDASDLDASLAPVEEVKIVEFRPGTTIYSNPALTSTTGLDGQLYTDRRIPPTCEIQVIRLTDNKVVVTAKVEADGFFIVEGLTPAKYELKIIGVNDPPEPQPIEIGENVDWIDSVIVSWLSPEYIEQQGTTINTPLTSTNDINTQNDTALPN